MSDEWRQEIRYMTTQQVLDLVSDMQRIVHFFENRDKMNADVHCSDVRESPITTLAKEIKQTIDCMSLVKP